MKWILAVGATLLLVLSAVPLTAEPVKTPAPPAACAKAPKGMSCIPGGHFVRGVDKDPYGGYKRCYQLGRPRTTKSDAVPSAKVYVSTFYMDQHEVTYGDFMACVKAGKCNTRKCVRAKKCNKKAGPRYIDFNRPKQPIAGVSWYAAVEYCKAMGKHLPTEAEWEKAARGPDGEIHPWGNESATCDRAVIKHPKKGRSCGVKKRGSSRVGRVFKHWLPASGARWSSARARPGGTGSTTWSATSRSGSPTGTAPTGRPAARRAWAETPKAPARAPTNAPSIATRSSAGALGIGVNAPRPATTVDRISLGINPRITTLASAVPRPSLKRRRSWPPQSSRPALAYLGADAYIPG